MAASDAPLALRSLAVDLDEVGLLRDDEFELREPEVELAALRGAAAVGLTSLCSTFSVMSSKSCCCFALSWSASRTAPSMIRCSNSNGCDAAGSSTSMATGCGFASGSCCFLTSPGFMFGTDVVPTTIPSLSRRRLSSNWILSLVSFVFASSCMALLCDIALSTSA